MVYTSQDNRVRLAWAARAGVQPIALAVAAFGAQQGLVLGMDEAGMSCWQCDVPCSVQGQRTRLSLRSMASEIRLRSPAC